MSSVKHLAFNVQWAKSSEQKLSVSMQATTLKDKVFPVTVFLLVKNLVGFATG